MITLVISAFRRPYYLERQLDGWERARGLENVDRMIVAVGVSERFDDQLAVIKRFGDRVPFPVVMTIDDPPAGPHAAIGGLFRDAFAGGADFTFFTDEDMLPADDVLELVAWGMEHFRDNQQVLSVNAHSECAAGWDGPHQRDDPDADPAIVRLKPYHNPWGFGLWRDRWEKTLQLEWDWDGRHRGYDWNIMRVLRDRRMVAATPDASRTNHIGYRGGMFSNASTLAFSDAASFREHRDPVEFRLEEAP
jgi:hypothetical protein